MLAATFGGVMSTIGYILIAVGALMLMVVIHELGHYLAGKLLGFGILEFAIGFGPAIFKKKSKKTGVVFSIRPVPLGGFCQFEDEEEDSQSPTAFNNQPPWKRLIVLFSGAFFNFIAALIIITFIFTFYGQILPTVHSVLPDSENYGVLQDGDAILKVNGKQMNVLMAEDYSAMFEGTGDTAEITVLRDGKAITLTLKKSECINGNYDGDGNFIPVIDEETGEAETYYGFGFKSALGAVKLGFFRSLGRSFSYMFFLVYKILAILGQLITGKIGMENAGGPISTISVISEAASTGFATLTFVICLISANLAVFNLLPFPALDGSKMVFCLIEWIFKKPIKRSIENAIHFAGFVLLIGFALFADVFRIFTVGL